MDEVFATLDRWRSGPPPADDVERAAALDGLEACGRSLASMTGEVAAGLRLAAAMLAANLLRDLGRRAEALEHYARGETEASTLATGGPTGRNELANLWTNRGICRMAEADGAAEALADFERAIALRRELPLEEVPIYRWGLSAGWINRGDALARLGRDDEAVESYDEGLAELARMEQTPMVRGRRVVAWNNRGLALLRLGRDEEARTAFREALDQAGDEVLLASVARLHLSRVTDDGEEALVLARRVVGDLAERERRDPLAAELGLKARHRVCERLCEWLDDREGRVDDWIAEASDRVEEGLELARAWESAGVLELREVAYDLFRVGLRVYRTCQPQFLAEFVVETLDPGEGGVGWDERFRDAGLAALRGAMADGRARGAEHGARRAERELEILVGLRRAEDRLAGWASGM